MRYRSLVLALALLAGLAPRADAQVWTFEPARRGWLGFWYERAETRSPGETRLTLTVTSVEKDSPAEKAGLRKDDAILRINGLGATQELLGTLGSSLEPGDTVTFQVRRDGRVQNVMLVAAKPPQNFAQRIVVSPRVNLDSVRGMARIFIDSARAGFDTTFFRRLPSGDSAFARMFIWGDSVLGDSARMQIMRGRFPSWMSGDSIRTYTFRGEFPRDSVHFFAPGRDRVFGYVRPGDLPGHDIVVQAWGGGSRAIAGAELQELNPELARYFRVASGVLVINVPENTPARRAGLRSGDVITAVEGSTVSAVPEVRRGIERAAGPSVRLDVVRNGEKLSLQLKK